MIPSAPRPDSARAQRHGFVLLPGFSLLALGAATSALDAVNELLQQRCYEALALSLDGHSVRAGCGTLVTVAQGLGSGLGSDQTPGLPPLDGLHIVCDAAPALLPQPVALLEALRHAAKSGALLGGIGTGAALLAAAGVLNGHRATLHWASAQTVAQAHAQVLVSNKVYEIDRGRISCAGATAALDMMLAWLAQRHGERIGQELLAHFGLERLRPADERQRTPPAARAGMGSAKLAEAVALMEANLGEPLPTEDIARLVGVSRRQLERLFKQHLDELPSRYYADLRLSLARRLLQQTSQSILQVGLSSGFSSGSHFSNAYRARFGRTPREERSQRAGAWRQPPATDGPAALPAPEGDPA